MMRGIGLAAAMGLAAMGLVAAELRAEVRLPAVISDHAVLQAEGPVRVWGWGDAGEGVTVRFAGQTVAATTDASGHWAVLLKPMKAGVAGSLVVEGKNRIEVKDVLVGEVWMATGQSNMERALLFSNDLAKVYADAANPQIRLFHVEHAIVAAPAEDVKGKWELCDAKSAKNFSAAAYFFGQRLQKQRKVPVGLIESAFGGTPIESWLSDAAMKANPSLAFVHEEWTAFLKTMPDLMAQYDAKVEAWKAKAMPEQRAAFDAGRGVEGAPAKPRGTGSQNDPSGLYNGMIAPLTKYSIRGILWNQGENNAGPKAFRYRDLFTAMIGDWRTAWCEGDVPFLFVQLSRYKFNTSFTVLRESQAEALHLAKTAMAVSVDVGMVNDVHYPDKATVGDRLFRMAQKVAYGEKVVDSGPTLKELTTDGSSLRLWFGDAGGWLVMKTPMVPAWGTLTAETKPEDRADGKAIVYAPPTAAEVANAFQIAGADGKFFPAKVTVDGASVVLSSEKVAVPMQVCYAWQDTVPAVVLWNGAGLPASPFRRSLIPGALPDCPGDPKPIKQ